MKCIARWPLSFVPGLLALLSAGIASAQGTPPSSPKPQPRISFEEKAVVASGLTPGGTVAWFGVQRRVDADFSGEIVRLWDAGKVGADGTARIDLPTPVSPRSLWTAVDVTSGEFDVVAPSRYRIARPEKPGRLRAGQGANPDDIEDERPYLAGLVVRPGEGAWSFSGGDGGPRDEDGQNDGRVRFAMDKLDPLPGSPAAPAKAKGTDLWIVVDLLKMEVSVHKGGVAQ
jgi:hypothetical protein